MTTHAHTAGDVYQLFSWYGFGPNHKAPNFVRDWPGTHHGQLAGTAHTPAEVGEWLRQQLTTRRASLGEDTYLRYMEYVDQATDSFQHGQTEMCWAIWAADKSNLLSLAVVRERPNPGAPYLTGRDRALLASA